MTWTNFKDQWAKKDPGAWSFEDARLTKEDESRKKLFKEAWALVGP